MHKKTILIVDDSTSVRLLLTMILEKSNFKVIKAKDGIDALEKINNINEETIDLIITDINMPDLDGIAPEQIAQNQGSQGNRRIGKDQNQPSVPAIDVSARDRA